MTEQISRRKGLPPRILAALYLAAILLPLALAWSGGLEHRRLSMTLVAATGIASAAMILMQMVTSGRFEAISGRIGIDVTMAFHKWAAPLALAFALAHALLLVGPPDAAHPHRLVRRLVRFSTEDGLVDARLALGLLALLVLMALYRDRLPFRYEIWRGSHALAALGLVVLLLWHILGDGRLVGSTAAHWVVFALAVTIPAAGVYLRRLTRPADECWRVDSVRKVADRLWEVTLANPKGRRLDFREGQFAWAAFGGGRLPLHDHPFSIASAPGEDRLRFLIQEAGDFTRTMGRLAPGTRVGLDAPHGSFGPGPEGTGPILLIAGGVGIAPILSILRDLAARGSERPVRFLYACRNAEAMLPADMFRPACDTLGIAPVLLVDRGAGAAGLAQGPLTEAHLARLLDGQDPSEAEALICGPGPMMTMATDALLRLGVPSARIDYERFSYSVDEMSDKDRRMLAGFGGLFLAVVVAVAAYPFL
jgi:predicted ferric reductase